MTFSSWCLLCAHCDNKVQETDEISNFNASVTVDTDDKDGNVSELTLKGTARDVSKDAAQPELASEPSEPPPAEDATDDASSEAAREALMPLKRQGSEMTKRYKEQQRLHTTSSNVGSLSQGGVGTLSMASGNQLVPPSNLAEQWLSSGSAASSTAMATRPSLAALRSRSFVGSGESSPSKMKVSALQRLSSQLAFHAKDQTVIVFDWDDTLFPTYFINEELHLNWKLPIEKQRKHVMARGTTIEEVQRKVGECEANAYEVLKIACSLAHVVVVTLAASSWVDTSCNHYYPKVGKLIKEQNVPVVYALDQSGREEVMKKAKLLTSYEEVERHWGLIKGRAIRTAVENFYSQYEGQTWKNILSVGDSYFERYGLLAATKAYILGRHLSTLECGDDELSPTQEGAWETTQNGQVKKVRAKCCKFVDQPDPEELTVELMMISQWLEHMVRLDSGFDLDLEVLDSEEQVKLMEAVLRGERPVSDLPATSRVGAEADRADDHN